MFGWKGWQDVDTCTGKEMASHGPVLRSRAVSREATFLSDWTIRTKRAGCSAGGCKGMACAVDSKQEGGLVEVSQRCGLGWGWQQSTGARRGGVGGD